MGKDWYWAGSKSSKSKRGEANSGCMCAVFQAFDFHPFHFPLYQQQQSSFKSTSSIPQDLNNVPKGAEATRNSLESEDGTVSCISKEENLKVPKNIRTKTSGNTRARAGSLNDISSEIISSPGTKTPTLVARLMGLDLLPDANSSSSSSSSCLSTPNTKQVHHLRPRQHIQVLMKHRNSTGSCNNATIRSLHETPRRSDVEHRLSLQINKENNMGLGEDLDLPRFSFSKRKYDENNYSKSPSHYARQIVKQVKESVSRKVGLDITNTVKSREHEREELVGQLRFKKSSVKSSQDESSPGKHSNSSYSPRLSRFMDTKHNKPNTKPSSPLTPKDQNTTHTKPPSPPPIVNNIEAHVSRVLTKAKPQALAEVELQNHKPVPKCKKICTNEKLISSRFNKLPQTSSIRKKQEEAFIIRPPPSPTRANDIKTKTKRTHPLPSNLHSVPNLLPIKTDPSPPATKIPQKQSQVSDAREPKGSTQVSSCSRQRYKQETTYTLATRGTIINDEDKSNGVSTTTGPDAQGPEFQYIATILNRTGPHNATLLQPHFHFQWFSPFHPLDPSIFHHLEHYPTSNPTVYSLYNDKDNILKQKNQLGPRCNRRLLFDLVDEVLSEILFKPKYCYRGGMFLLEAVWKRVRSFPRAKCEVMEDIDGLIEMKEEGEDEEREGLVAEIEGSILETLVHETVTVMVGGFEMKWVRT